MDRISYWIEKALQRAKITPDRGGEILYQAFKHLLAESLLEAETIEAGLEADNARLREALGDLIEDHAEGCDCRHHQALNHPVREDAEPSSSTEAPGGNVIPLGKIDAAAPQPAKEAP